MQLETIGISYDPSGAKQAADQANVAIASNEKAADRVATASNRAAAAQGDAILRITSSTKRQVDSMLSAVDKRIASYKSPLDQIASQKQIAVDRAAGDPVAVKRLTAAFDELAAAERNAQAAAKNLGIQNVVASVESRILALKSPLEQLAHQKNTAIQAVIGDPAAVRKVAADFDVLIKAEKDAQTAARGLDLSRQIKDGIQDPIGSAGGILQGFVSKIGATGVIAGAVLLGIGIAAKEAFGLIRESSKAAEDVVNLGDKLGVTAGEAAVLNAQARIAGVGVDSLGGLVRKLSTTLSDGGTEARATVGALNSIGVSVAGVGNAFRDPIAILRDLSGQLGALPGRAAQVDLLTKAFGRGAVELLPLILHFKELERQAKETGVGGLDALYKRMQAVNDKIDVLSIKWDILKLKLSEKIIATVEFVTEGFEQGEKLLDLFGSKAAKVGGLLAGPLGLLAGASAGIPKFLEPTPFPNERAKPPEPPADAFFNSSQRRGNFLLQQFQDRQTPEGVQEKLADLGKQRDRQLALIVPGRDEKIQAANIAAVKSLDAQIEKQKELLRILNGLDEATRQIELKRREEISKSLELIAQNEKKNLDERAKIAFDSLDTLAGRDVLSARKVEDLKLEIQKETIDKVSALEKQAIEERAKIDIDKVRSDAKRAGIPKLAEPVVAQLTAQRDERLLQVNREAADARNKADEDLNRARILRDREAADQSIALRAKNEDAFAAIDARAAQRTRDQQLDSLALINAQTVAQKIAVEEARAVIEARFLKASEASALESINRRLKVELDLFEIQAQREGLSEVETQKRRALIEQEFQIERRGIAEETDAAISANARKTAIDNAKIIQEYNLSIFDRFKRESEGIFDAMSAKGQNVFQAIGSAFKNAMLTAIKDVVSSRVAASLTELVTGQKVTLQPGNIGAGPLGQLAGQLGIGAIPVFGKQQSPVELKTKLDLSNHLGDLQLRSGAAPVFVTNAQPSTGKELEQVSSAVSGIAPALGGIAIGLGSLGSKVPAGAVSSTIDFGQGAVSTGPASVFGPASILGPGATSGFAGPLAGFGGNGGFGGLGNILQSIGTGGAPITTPPFVPGGAGTSTGGLFSNLLSLPKNILSSVGNLGMDRGGLPGVNGKPGTDLGGGLFGGHGIGGVGGGALLAGGGILAFNGLQRGGVGGLLETTAGGALIGAKFGGPIGALIGAGVGAVAGTIRLFFKTGVEKVREKIKATYPGIDISDKGVLTQILNVAKQSYGGNIDIAIRSPEVRSLIELYGLAHGQNVKGIVAHAQASVFSNTGGVLTAQPTFFNGEAVFPGQTQAKIGTPRLTPQGFVIDPPLRGANTVQATSVASLNAATEALTRAAASIGSQQTVINVPGAKEFFQNETVTVMKSNPRAISQTTSTGMGLSSARRDIAAAALSPNFLTA